MSGEGIETSVKDHPRQESKCPKQTGIGENKSQTEG